MKRLWTMLPGLLLAWGAWYAQGHAEEATSKPSPPKAPKKIVFLAGKASHARGAHDWPDDAKLLKRCLDAAANVKQIRTELHLDGWPKDAGTLDDADVIVLLADGFQRHPFFRSKDRTERVDRLMRRGVGLVCIHYAVAAVGGGEAKLLEWIGGLYKQGYSRNPMHTVQAVPAAPDHPICKGCKPFTATDEFYYRIWFGKDPKRVVPILTAEIGQKQPKREVLAWAFQREDGGRAFGLTGGHYHKNWQIESLRRMVLNAILWAAKVESPAGGVQSAARPGQADQQGFVPLFNGRDLTGWKADEKARRHWAVADGVLKFDGHGPHLWTERSFADFILKVDWRLLTKNGDSGIYLRGTAKAQVNIWTWEMGSGEVWGYRTDKKQPEAVRQACTPKLKADNPVGQWNRFVITMVGERLTVVLNGKEVISKARLPGVPAAGPVALQKHGNPLEFRDICIKELKAAKP